MKQATAEGRQLVLKRAPPHTHCYAEVGMAVQVGSVRIGGMLGAARLVARHAPEQGVAPERVGGLLAEAFAALHDLLEDELLLRRRRVREARAPVGPLRFEAVAPRLLRSNGSLLVLAITALRGVGRLRTDDAVRVRTML